MGANIRGEVTKVGTTFSERVPKVVARVVANVSGQVAGVVAQFSREVPKVVAKFRGWSLK